MWCKEFIYYIILACEEGLLQLGSLFYQKTAFTNRVIYYKFIFGCSGEEIVLLLLPRFEFLIFQHTSESFY